MNATEENANWSPYCLAPLYGIVAGFILGWILHFKLHITQDIIGQLTDFAGRMFVLSVSLYGWSLGLMLQQKKIHRGGELQLNDDSKKKYQFLMISGLLLLFVSMIFLLEPNLIAYYICAFCFLIPVWGEVRYGSPTYDY